MAFNFNKILPTMPEDYVAPENEADEGDTRRYGIYESQNPGTPYIPKNPKTDWWTELPFWTPNLLNNSTDITGYKLVNHHIDAFDPANKYDSDWFPGWVSDDDGLYGENSHHARLEPEEEARVISEWNQYQDDVVNNPDKWKNFDAIYSSEITDKSFFDQIDERRSNKKGRYKKYNTFTGADIVPTISLPNSDVYTIGEISTISISTHSETFPVRMLGRRGPQGFTRGARTIAGSIIFSQFDLYPFYNMIDHMYKSKKNSDFPWSNNNEIFPLADSLPPFDITISFMNEYGNSSYAGEPGGMLYPSSSPQGSVLRLYGVVIVDDGMTLSIDDLVPETVYSYMAAGIAPMHYPSGWKQEID